MTQLGGVWQKFYPGDKMGGCLGLQILYHASGILRGRGVQRKV